MSSILLIQLREMQARADAGLLAPRERHEDGEVSDADDAIARGPPPRRSLWRYRQVVGHPEGDRIGAFEAHPFALLGDPNQVGLHRNKSPCGHVEPRGLKQDLGGLLAPRLGWLHHHDRREQTVLWNRPVGTQAVVRQDLPPRRGMSAVGSERED